MVVWEFTQGVAENSEEFKSRVEMKPQTSHWVLVHLQHKFQDFNINFQPMVMGVLTSA